MGNNNIQLSLPELAQSINGEHAACIDSMRAGLQHAIKAGEYLTQAKAQLEHGAWLPWLAANCQFSERTAQNYMRVFDNREELTTKSATVADLSYREAIGLLAEPQETEPHKDNETTGQAGALPILDYLQEQFRNGDAVYKSLKAIRDKELYKRTHTTFEAYCKEKWDIDDIDDLFKAWEHISDPVQKAKITAVFEIKRLGGKITPVGLEFTREISREEWLAIGEQLFIIDRLSKSPLEPLPYKNQKNIEAIHKAIVDDIIKKHAYEHRGDAQAHQEGRND